MSRNVAIFSERPQWSEEVPDNNKNVMSVLEKGEDD